MYVPTSLIAAAIFAFTPASDTPQAPSYKVEFTINDGTAANPQPSRRYSMLVDESRKAAFQALGDVFNNCGSPQSIDTGAKIELTLHSSGDKVAIEGSIDLSSVTGIGNVGSLCEPIIGERKIAFHTKLDLGKPATLDDDPRAGAQRHVEAVVTEVN
ncbi:MAG TPA: hypothetical protein VMB03_20135 [Bryobacteraceae bacterium]|nr:hypothetical protein [Bryobacteraceae bacterium]